MIRYTRPPKSAGFDEKVKSAKEALSSVAPGEHSLPEESFPAHWGDYKFEFRKAQSGKCGYCETQLSEVGAVDHFRPKGAVWALQDDPETWGKELEDLTNVRGRDPTVLSGRGYFWLAYDWDNYVFACDRCNSGWKRSFFPVAETPRTLPPSPDHPETPLLLNPYDSEAPWRHFDYDDLGNIVSASPDDDFGYETIRTCGLDRSSLAGFRRRLVPVLIHNVSRYLRGSPTAKRDAWCNLRLHGTEESAYAGMVRRWVEKAVGCPWEEFVNSEPPTD